MSGKVFQRYVVIYTKDLPPASHPGFYLIGLSNDIDEAVAVYRTVRSSACYQASRVTLCAVWAEPDGSLFYSPVLVVPPVGGGVEPER